MTSQTTAAALLRRLAQGMDDRDWDAVAETLSPAFHGRYLHTGEEFDAASFVRLNRDYPGAWRFELEDLVAEGDRAVGRSRVSNAEETYHVATFIRADDEHIVDLVEVWTESVGAPPADKRP